MTKLTQMVTKTKATNGKQRRSEMMTKRVQRLATAVSVLLAMGTAWQAAQAATVAYVGAEVSTASSGSWGTSGSSGYKKDFRSTDAGTKAWTLSDDHPNAYGADGYIMFGQTDASVTQEASGKYTGTIYTGTRSDDNFNNPVPGIASIAILGGYVDTSNQGVAPLDDASLGIGTSVADLTNGTWWYTWYTGSQPDGWSYDTVTNLFRITLDGSAKVPTIRVGILTDRGDSQRPGAIGLDPGTAGGGDDVWQASLIGGFGQYNRPTWYFFDITNAGAGDTVDIAIKPWPTIYGSRSNIRGLVFDVVTIPEPASALLLGAAGLLALRRRRW
jgi:hypothetical protein